LARAPSVEAVFGANSASATAKGTPPDSWPESRLSNHENSLNARFCLRARESIRPEFDDPEYAATDIG
jgi:hypothetical protein